MRVSEEKYRKLTVPSAVELSTEKRSKKDDFETRLREEAQRSADLRRFKAQRMPDYEKKRLEIAPSQKPLTHGVPPQLRLDQRFESKAREETSATKDQEEPTGVAETPEVVSKEE